MMEDARRRHKPLHLVWFDPRNAFGSIPHRQLWFSMRRIGLPDEMLSILMDIYNDLAIAASSEEHIKMLPRMEEFTSWAKLTH